MLWYQLVVSVAMCNATTVKGHAIILAINTEGAIRKYKSMIKKSE